jgi:hypothetical protein
MYICAIKYKIYMNNSLKLKKVEVNSYAGINPNEPLLLVLPENGSIVNLEGDNGTAKTSSLMAIKSLLTGEYARNAINTETQTVKGVMEFEKDGTKYRVILRKDTIVLETAILDGWSAINKPSTMLNKLIGGVGATPMYLKGLEAKKQIEYFKQFTSVSEEAELMGKMIDIKISENYSLRTSANKRLAETKALLATNEYYKNQELWEKRIAEMQESEEVNIQALAVQHTSYERAKLGIENLELQSSKEETEIAELEQQLKLKKLAHETTKIRIEDGKKWLVDNENIVADFANASKKQSEIAENKKHREEYQKMLTLCTQNNANEDEAQRLDQAVDEYRKQKLDYISLTTPNIEGLEIITKQNKGVMDILQEITTENPLIDEDKKLKLCKKIQDDDRDDVLYFGKSINEISETELWELCTKVWAQFGIKVIIIDNIASLGTKMVETLNKFIHDGGYVFASQMNRAQEKIKITISDKIKN